MNKSELRSILVSASDFANKEYPRQASYANLLDKEMRTNMRLRGFLSHLGGGLSHYSDDYLEIIRSVLSDEFPLNWD